MSRLDDVLRGLRADMNATGRPWALLGGLAVSARTEPRFTRDVDIAVAVTNDDEAEQLVYRFRDAGYRPGTLVEQDAVGRLATARLAPPDEPEDGVVVDLLFASSGIEPEIVDAAEELDILPDVSVPVARAGHLLALKLLSRDDETRPQDAADIRALATEVSNEDRRLARDAIDLIEKRGFARGRDLRRLLDDALDRR